MQEVTVREAVGMASHVTCDCDLQAIQAILHLCEQLTQEEINEYISATAIRMHNGEWYTSKQVL